MTPFADLLDVLYEDNHLLGLNKPAGWPTTHFDGTDETVDRLAKAYLKEKHAKPGNVFLGVVHRLDKPTSGALVFARTSKAAARLSEQFREGGVEKVYWAVVEDKARTPWAATDSGAFDDWLFHDDANHRVTVAAADTLGAKPARLLWSVLGRHGGLAWLELRPHTGRKHQLRVQLASRGGPIYGDDKIRVAAPPRPRHRAARPVADGAAPDSRQPSNAHRPGAEALARPVRPPAERNDVMTADDKLVAIREAAGVTFDDFAAACLSIADHPEAAIDVFTGTAVPSDGRPVFGRDGPLGAVFLARALIPLGIPVAVSIEAAGRNALSLGLRAAKLPAHKLTTWDTDPDPGGNSPDRMVSAAPLIRGPAKPRTHYVAVGRVGPAADGRCHARNGDDITDDMVPVEVMFPQSAFGRVRTIGVGSNGNEIGMGKLAADVGPGLPDIRCRVPTDFLIVSRREQLGGVCAGRRRHRAARRDADGRPVRPEPRTRDSRRAGPRRVVRERCYRPSVGNG